MKKRVCLVLVFTLLFSMFSIDFVFALDPLSPGERICCGYPGPADESLYEWRASEAECQSPEDVLWGDKVVDDHFCEDNFPDNPDLQGCVDGCKAGYEDEESRSECISSCKKKRGIDYDSDYRCEDMTKEHCEAAEDCESILGPSFCEGSVCTTDMVWEGCKYKYEDTFLELDEEYEDEEIDPGITPDSPFYFLDGIFGDTREEKIAEVKAMIAQGDYESARKALEKYMVQAKKFEDDPDPAKRDEARRAAAAIHGMLESIKEDISEDDEEEFYDDVLNSEGDIVTSVEISSKIKELCEQLAELDPLEYSKMCRTDDDAPKWQRDLDTDLSAEQEATAREFVGIMKQCFKTSGQDCACEEIPFYDFSIACSKAVPLVTACDINGDEIACDELENLDMPELPEWLEPIWQDLEGDMNEAQYEMHMPPECVEAGVTDPKNCGKVMIEQHSPLECRAALLESNCDSESECREICNKIMFKLHTPQNCIDKGITDGDECAEFMDNFRGDDFGPADGEFRGPNCMIIEDPMERLDCYDNKGNQMGDYYGPGEGEMPEGEITWQCKEHRIHWPPDCEKFMSEELPEIEKQQIEEGEKRREEEGDWRAKSEECASKCDLEIEWWDYRDGECICYATEGTGPKPGEWGGEDWEGGSGCGDCSSECPEGAYTDCVNDQCVCGEVPDTGPDYGPGEGPGEPGDDGSTEGGGDDTGDGSGGDETPPDDGGGDDSGGDSDGDSDGDSGGDDSGGDNGGEDAPPITGNAFLSYYWG